MVNLSGGGGGGRGGRGFTEIPGGGVLPGGRGGGGAGGVYGEFGVGEGGGRGPIYRQKEEDPFGENALKLTNMD